MWVAVLCSLIFEAFFTLCIWGMVSWRLYSDWSRIIRMADDKVITNQFHFPPLIFSIHLWNVITYCMSYSYITDTWLHIPYSYTDVITYCTSYSFFTETWLHIVRSTQSSQKRDYILHVLLSSQTRYYILYVLLLLHGHVITYSTFYSFFTETWLHIACQTPSSQNEQQSLLAGDDVTTQHVPLLRKLCYAIGGPPYQITNTVINFFLSIFLLEVAEVQ